METRELKTIAVGSFQHVMETMYEAAGLAGRLDDEAAYDFDRELDAEALFRAWDSGDPLFARFDVKVLKGAIRNRFALREAKA